MSLQSDYAVRICEESAYGGAETGTPVYLWAKSGLKLTVDTAQGKGYRPSSRGVDYNRSSVTRRKVEGGLSDMDAVLPNGLRLLLKLALGVQAGGAVVDGGTLVKHWLFSPTTSDFLGSAVIQSDIPRLGGTLDGYKFTGCQCSELKVGAKAGELASVETSWVGKDQEITTAATPSFPAEVDQLGFADMTIAWGGAITAPTATALGAGGTALDAVRDFEADLKNTLDDGRWHAGSGLVPARAAALKGGAEDLLTGKLTREHVDRTLIDAAIARTVAPLLVTFTGREASDGITRTLQMYAPAVRFTAPLTPESADGDVIATGFDWAALQPATGAPVLFALREEG